MPDVDTFTQELVAKPTLVHQALGAQVLQAGLGGQLAVFYLSPLSMGASGPALATTPARGGVPVLFPQFADKGALPKHGLVRTVCWNLIAEDVSEDIHSLRYGLEIQPHDYPAWPHRCKLMLAVETSHTGLAFELQVRNCGSKPFSWTGGLHPYFAVEDVLTCSLRGLGELAVQDRYDADLQRQPSGDLHWTAAPFERLYDACPPVVLNAGNYALLLSASGFDQWMVWNPGDAGAGALTDLPAGDWRRFVCVEPVCVDRPVVLAPGETFHGQLRIQVCSP